MSVNIPINADLNSGSFEAIKSQLNEIARRAGYTEKEITEMNKAIEDGGKKSKKAAQEIEFSMKGLEKAAGRAGMAMLGAFSVQFLMKFAGEVIRVTGEFQKMEAVLTNSLGSKSAAQVSMRMLQDFAAKTPFQVDKLTAAYVKLVNQGFKPTKAELTKLGDLASSTGKDFDQLVEAMLDAQTGEFERLKEFGIKSRVEGDKVKFTFKGVTQEVQNSEAAIRGYIMSLGDMEGVSGSMAAISDTVAGKMSNLSDNMTNLMKVIGDGSSGLIAGVLDFANNALGSLSTRIDAINNATKDDSGIVAFLRMIAAMADPNYGAMLEVQAKAAQVQAEAYQNMADEGRRVFEEEGRIRKQKIELAEAEAKRAAEEAKRIGPLGIIKKLEMEISELTKERKQVDSVGEISRIDARIEKLKQELAMINMLAGDLSLDRMNPFEGIDDSIDQTLKSMNAKMKAQFDTSIKQASDWIEQNKEVTAKAKEFWSGFATEVAWSVSDLYMNLEAWGAQHTQRETERLEMEKESKLALAGEDKDQRLLIEEEFAVRREQLRQQERARQVREAILQRALAIFSITQSTLQASAAALAPPPLGFGPVKGAFIAAGIKVIGALNVAAAAAATIPAFKEGVFQLEGPGTETSDSIHARLSKGESVVHASGTRKFGDILKPIIEDKNMTYEKLMGIMMDKVPMKLRGDILQTSTKAVNERYIVDGIVQGLGNALKNQKETVIQIDQAGLTVRAKRRGRVIKQMNDFLYG
jgi:hypothetical protein